MEFGMDGAFNLDNALDTQRIFRHIMNSFSHPFRIYNIFDGAEIGPPDGDSAAIIGLCGVFLDNTVSLYVHGAPGLAAEIGEATYVKAAAIEDADYIIMDDARGFDQLEKVNAGSLVNPHKGATLIVITPTLGGTEKFMAEGPGIKGRAPFSADPAIAELLYRADALNIEYPKGFEIIFLTLQGDICAVPRHIKIHREGAA